ncbi:hypothetical protein QNH03_gp60 [Escherichia phage vB_EcoM_Bp10]|nr:hypothetical protein QNH03_gp60 [Escherichia phage vB_EcoM_Bp10]QEM42572.1 hypothetical protein vBEcoMBp10_60 [Escherichia phage vB_EcoM_Bp10]
MPQAAGAPRKSDKQGLEWHNPHKTAPPAMPKQVGWVNVLGRVAKPL